MVRSGKQDAGKLVYPKHLLAPQDLLNFSEMAGFVGDWQDLQLNVEFDLLALQVAIMANPKGGSSSREPEVFGSWSLHHRKGLAERGAESEIHAACVTSTSRSFILFFW
jgi:hypothetical protein